jgi:MoxR-like ATPase
VAAFPALLLSDLPFPGKAKMLANPKLRLNANDEIVLIEQAALRRGRQPLVGVLSVVDEDVSVKDRHLTACGLRRVLVVGTVKQGSTLMAEIREPEQVTGDLTAATPRLLKLLRRVERRASDSNLLVEIELAPRLEDVGPDEVADWVAQRIGLGDEARRQLLSTVSWVDRLPLLERLVNTHFRRSARFQDQPPKAKLGSLEARAKSTKLPPEVRRGLDLYLGGAGRDKEAAAIILDLVWDAPPARPVDLEQARQLLDASHEGLEPAKRAIQDHLVMLEWQRRQGIAATGGAALCFVGPPGTGKTSLAEDIAVAMGRRLERIAIGGLDDISLVGANRGYNHASAGEVVRRLRAAAAHPSEVVWLLDEVDKASRWSDHTVVPVLLSLLDPSQNSAWQDRFLDGVRLDLSGSLFLATANDANAIPAPLLDRLQLIELPAYSLAEQIKIGRSRLIPKLLSRVGAEGVITIDDGALESLVFDDPRSPGCRQLEHRLQVVVARALELHMATEMPVLVDAATARNWVPAKQTAQIGFQRSATI